MPSPAGIGFVNCHSIGKRLFVSHGYDFDNIMPRNRWFILIFRAFHRVRMLMGAESVHVAHYAKRFGPLYRVLRRHVAANAAEYAREQGFGVVTCGHTHYVEDVVIDGVRYINTGAWTERPVFYLAVREGSIDLVAAEGGGGWQT
jgi:UDP-2,3-diacylglucosamine pyrophosphatase LpxH